MNALLDNISFNEYMEKLSSEYDFFGPVLKKNKGRYSDTNLITYEIVSSFEDMYWDEKSDFSAKEILLPLNETLFYFNDNGYQEVKNKMRKTIVFLRSCDLHAIKRTDAIYLENKYQDIYYFQKRELVKFALIGCASEFDNCMCVSFNTNKSDNYQIGINLKEDSYELDIKDSSLEYNLKPSSTNVTIDYISENKTKVNIPEHVELSKIIDANIWDEYSTRCIGCGACNFVCPTCTCFTMQDIFYDENENIGERKRVAASCEIDGFTKMAGDHEFRKDHKDRMRFKVMHKISDFKKRFGYDMCVGCGRCDDVCPEHILFSRSVNKLDVLVKELNDNE